MILITVDEGSLFNAIHRRRLQSDQMILRERVFIPRAMRNNVQLVTLASDSNYYWVMNDCRATNYRISKIPSTFRRRHKAVVRGEDEGCFYIYGKLLFPRGQQTDRGVPIRHHSHNVRIYFRQALPVQGFYWVIHDPYFSETFPMTISVNIVLPVAAFHHNRIRVEFVMTGGERILPLRKCNLFMELSSHFLSNEYFMIIDSVPWLRPANDDEDDLGVENTPGIWAFLQ